jgi:hypothetical protein
MDSGFISDLRSKIISAGQLITLQDPDSLCCITIQSPHTTTTAHNNNKTVSLLTNGEGKTEDTTNNNNNNSNSNQQEKTNQELVIMSPQYQMRDIVSDVNVGTHLLWLIQKADVSDGGPIFVNGDYVTLSNINTGLFLKLDELTGEISTIHDREFATAFELVPASTASSTNVAQIAQNETTVYLTAGDYWLSHAPIATNNANTTNNTNTTSPPQEETNTNTNNTTTTNNNNNNNSTTNTLSKCIAITERTKAASFIISSMLHKKLGNHVYIGVQAVKTLKKIVRIAYQFHTHVATARELTNAVKTAAQMLDNLIYFLVASDEPTHQQNRSSNRNHHHHHHHQNDAKNQLSKEIMRTRQNMMREQGLIDVLLQILKWTETEVFNQVETKVDRKSKRTRQSFNIRTNTNSNLFNTTSRNTSSSNNHNHHTTTTTTTTNHNTNASDSDNELSAPVDAPPLNKTLLTQHQQQQQPQSSSNVGGRNTRRRGSVGSAIANTLLMRSSHNHNNNNNNNQDHRGTKYQAVEMTNTANNNHHHNNNNPPLNEEEDAHIARAVGSYMQSMPNTSGTTKHHHSHTGGNGSFGSFAVNNNNHNNVDQVSIV